MVVDRRDPAQRRDRASSRALAALREECVRAGYLEGLDFHVDGFPTMVSSEYVDLDVTGGTYRVRYADTGSKRVVSVAPSLTAARRVFLDELARLAGGRGRGPRAGGQRPSGELAGDDDGGRAGRALHAGAAGPAGHGALMAEPRRATMTGSSPPSAMRQDLRPGNVWESAELPGLRRSTNGTQIVRIDPLTDEDVVIYR